jgi:hypothetical protein
MNMSPKQLPDLIDKESMKLRAAPEGAACLLEFKLLSPDSRYHRYVQMLILRDTRHPFALWRKFRASTSLARGTTLWESTREYHQKLIKGSVEMMKERIADLAFRAEVDERRVMLSLEDSKVIKLDRVIRTQDSKYSYLVSVSRKKKHADRF